MKVLAVVTPLSIYHVCSTGKTFLEEKFTCEEKLFSAMNMKNCGRRNVRKHKYIKGNYKYAALDIIWKTGQDENHLFIVKIKIGKIRKGVDYLSGFQPKVRPHKYKKAMYAIGNVCKKDLSKIISEFDKFEKLPYEENRPKHEPTDRYFCLSKQLAKWMMRSDALNWHGYGGYMERTSLSSEVFSTDEE